MKRNARSGIEGRRNDSASRTTARVLRFIAAGLLVPACLAAVIPAHGRTPPLPILDGAVPTAGILVPIGPARISLGIFPAEESRTARFALRNPGTNSVEILSVRKSCGCAEAELPQSCVAPGATVEIALRTLPGTLQGPFSKSFYVITSAPGDARVVQLSLSGRAVVRGAPESAERGDDPSAQPLERAGARHSGDDASDAGADAHALLAEFFVQEGCADCLRLRREFLPMLRGRYGERVRVVLSNTAERQVFLRLLALLERQGVDANEPLYLAVDRREVLAGWDAIQGHGIARLDAHLVRRTPALAGVSSTDPSPSADPSPVVRRFSRFTAVTVAIAGLADGLNPCAFTTMVFLTSLLAAGSRRVRSVLAGGVAFCLASFITYLFLGLGAFRAIGFLGDIPLLRQTLERGSAAVLVFLGLLSLRDAWRYSRRGDPRAVTLQLPDAVKRHIRHFARSRWRQSAVVGSGLACGVVVTLLESVCTGQLYLPTLVFMSREGGGGGRAWTLLVLYNVAFIIPLFAVFLLAALGMRHPTLVRWSRRQVVPAKLLLAFVFFALGAFLASGGG